jgi:hypothetical protein
MVRRGLASKRLTMNVYTDNSNGENLFEAETMRVDGN